MYWKKIICELHGKSSIKLGMIGCGQIGTLMFTEILNLGIIDPKDI